MVVVECFQAKFDVFVTDIGKDCSLRMNVSVVPCLGDDATFHIAEQTIRGEGVRIVIGWAYTILIMPGERALLRIFLRTLGLSMRNCLEAFNTPSGSILIDN